MTRSITQADPPEPPRRDAVRWLSPTELIRTGVTVAVGSLFGGYADKRDVMSGEAFAQPGSFDHADDRDADGGFWFDYVADTGDGFAPTCTVATLLGEEALEVGGRRLPRGRVLLMGGDQVYPVGGIEAYRERLVWPLDAQFPATEGPRPTLYAIPGNHDWYDGLTAFMRLFCQGRDIGGWQTAQRRSYYALRLPHDWWVLAIDIQLDTYIDIAQLDYFHRTVEAMGPDAQIIVCTATPAWYGAEDDQLRSLDRLTFFLREILAARGHRVRLFLTGDSHHYARYSLRGGGQQLITAGHGGAFTSPTHTLPPTLDVSAQLADPSAQGTDSERYERAPDTWPTISRSRRETWRVLDRLPLRNRLLVPLFALVQGVVAGGWVLDETGAAVTMALVVALGSWGFAQPARSGVLRKLAFGVPLAIAETAVSVAGAAVASTAIGGGPWAVAGVLVAVGVVAGVVSGLVLSVYLLIAGSLGANVNELFAAQSIEDHKGFLRLHIDADGELTAHPVGVHRSPRRWTWTPGAHPAYRPHAPIVPTPIEPPVTVGRASPRDRAPRA